jgi:hypothetical protein
MAVSFIGGGNQECQVKTSDLPQVTDNFVFIETLPMIAYVYFDPPLFSPK